MQWDNIQDKASDFLKSGYKKLISQDEVTVTHLFSKNPGVYVFIHEGKIIYVGECSEFHRRMYRHKKRTEVSTMRRAIGRSVFGQDKSGKYPKDIEKKIDDYITALKIKFLPVTFGRKELEEYVIAQEKPIYNKYGGSYKEDVGR